MKHKKHIESLVYSSVWITIGIILPMMFHVFGGVGKILLPMHIPVLLAGFMLPPAYAASVGVLTPLISSLLTGMPVLYPICPIMMIELGTYSLIISLLKVWGIHRIWLNLPISMILGRLMAGVMVYMMSVGFGLKMKPLVYLQGAIITGVPGIIIQLIAIPPLAYLLLRYRMKKVDIR